jgi:hypothetical protein
MRSIRRTLRGPVCAMENTTESCSAISNTLHKYMNKRNPYQSKFDTDVGFFSGVQYTISVKGSEGIMLGSAHASTTYEM